MKNLLLFYLILLFSSCSIFAVIFFLFLQNSLGKAVYAMYTAFFFCIALCISSGIFFAAARNNIYAAAAVNFLAAFIITAAVSKGDIYYSIIVSCSAALLTLVPALMTAAFKYFAGRPEYSFKIPAFILLSAFICASAYSAAAFISTLAYSPFKEESFFKYPQDGRIKYGYAGSSPLLMQKDADIAYTGTVYMYKKQLKIDFRKPKATGLSYYIDGRYTGSSTKPGAMTQNLVKLDNGFGKRDFPENVAKLIHKDYEKKIKDEIALWGDYAAFENIKTVNGGEEIIAAYEKNGKLFKSEIKFHENGIISEINSYEYSPEQGWTQTAEPLAFDSLGYCAYDRRKNRANPWKSEDFIYTGNYACIITENACENEQLKKKLFNPRKMDFENGATEWDPQKTVLDNALNYCGFSEEDPVSVYIRVKEGPYRSFKMLQTLEEMEMFVETVEKSKLSTNILENRDYFEDVIYDENQTAKFSISQPETGKSFKLWHYDGKFVTEKGLYVFIPDKNKDKICTLLAKYAGKQ